MTSLSNEVLIEALKDVFDPELGYNIVDLGLVYDLDVTGGDVVVTMTLTTPGCPASDMIQGGVNDRLCAIEGVSNVNVRLVWTPPWSVEAMSPAAKAHFGVVD